MDSRGGKSYSESDIVVIPPLPNCSYKIQLIVRPNTSVHSYAHKGSLSYTILPGEGAVEVNLLTSLQSNHK
ncbi:MAG: hypothetical protein PG981_000360 [Wolbachia endosymbiont of Ctenocephalides orientis wCori]|nr:MAG: hypothetical protein PG981_000360 [Wolbachia endosymbiont of Ctenocephalides orientis wCori]